MARRDVQALVFGTGLVVLCALQAAFDPGLATQIAILAPAVALLGLPHGALDLPMAETLWPLHSFRDRARFCAVYLTLSAVVIAAWLLAPGVALAAFLAYAVWHFSGDWAGAGAVQRAAGGLAVIGAPCLLQPEAVTQIFAYLAPDAAAATVAQGAGGAGLAALAVLAVTLASEPRPTRVLTEQTGLWAGAALLPPLAFFGAYFCLLHSPRHLFATWPALRDRARARRQAASVTVTTIAGAGFAGAALWWMGGVDAEGATLRVVFIGLAALTVPHMLLVDRFEAAQRGVAQDTGTGPTK